MTPDFESWSLSILEQIQQMSKFNKPHSFAPTTPGKRFRERIYPYIIETRHGKDPNWGACEACKKIAHFSINYEESKDAVHLSHVFLCNDHEKLTRYGKWDQVLRDMDRKIEGEK